MNFVISLLFKNKLIRQILVVVVFLFSGFIYGWNFFSNKQEKKDLTEAVETNERLNDADVGKGDSAADRDWLRERGKS